MSFPDITGALEAHLGVWADKQAIPVAWDNIQFNPPASGIYLTSHDMPASPYSIDLAGTSVISSGVYQVNVVVPKGSGKSEARRIAALVAALFPENAEIPGEGFAVWITAPPAIFSGMPDAVSYTVPVSINYRVHTSQQPPHHGGF